MTDNDERNQITPNPYETDRLVSQYCEFHYGEDYFGVENFPARCARFCIEYLGDSRKRRALEVGCAVGRATFELARVFPHVIGVDYSQRFIDLADGIREKGMLSYQVPVEGELAVCVERNLGEFGLDSARQRVEFLCEDAMALPAELNGFDLIFAGNLVDRLPRPRLFLSSLHERLNPGGLLVITSPYTWLPEFTPRKEWLGGYTLHGKDVYGLDGLKEALEPRLTLAEEPVDVPFVIRETARKFQHSLAQMSIWARG
jgi:putative 4-mercaptohistidine N1-methyltranferase